MIVEPYKGLHPAPPRLALLLDGERVLEEDGSVAWLRPLDKGVQVWASQDRVLELLAQRQGSALCWRGQPIRYAAEGERFRVRILGLTFPDDEAALSGLTTWRDWLNAEGAAPQSSLGGSSLSLLRAKLEHRLYCTHPQQAGRPPLRYTVGGRQERGPRGVPLELRGRIRHFDMRAAYARTLASLRYGGSWYKLEPGERLELLALEHPVFCRARVTLAGQWPPPLVKRERKPPNTAVAYFPAYPLKGTLQGVWTWAELQAAQEGGARVKLLEAWAHFAGGWQPFAPWWSCVEQGRQSLSGFPRLLVKAIGNALWGQFCIEQEAGRRSILRYVKERRTLRRKVTLLASGSGPRPAHDLSEYLTGVVRAQLYRFMLAAGDRLLSAHTDGGWVDCTSEELEFPDWRVKATASSIRILDPQILAYRLSDEAADRYVVAGWPAKLAGEQFERMWERTA